MDKNLRCAAIGAAESVARNLPISPDSGTVNAIPETSIHAD
jgi:hypothetical protein